MNRWIPIVALCLVSMLVACSDKKEDSMKQGEKKADSASSSANATKQESDLEGDWKDEKSGMAFKFEKDKFTVSSKDRGATEVMWKVAKKTDDTHWTLETQEKKKDGTLKTTEMAELEWIADNHIKIAMGKKGSQQVFELKK